MTHRDAPLSTGLTSTSLRVGRLAHALRCALVRLFLSGRYRNLQSGSRLGCAKRRDVMRLILLIVVLQLSDALSRSGLYVEGFLM